MKGTLRQVEDERLPLKVERGERGPVPQRGEVLEVPGGTAPRLSSQEGEGPHGSVAAQQTQRGWCSQCPVKTTMSASHSRSESGKDVCDCSGFDREDLSDDSGPGEHRGFYAIICGPYKHPTLLCNQREGEDTPIMADMGFPTCWVAEGLRVWVTWLLVE